MSSGSPVGDGGGPFQSPVEGPRAEDKRGRTLVWVLVGGTVGLLCLCSGLCLLPFGIGVYQAVGQQEAIGEAIEDCLEEVKSGDTEEVLEHFSSRAVKHGMATAEQVEALRDDPNFVGYESLSPDRVGLNFSAHSDATKPQGMVATVAGAVTYEDGGSGTFEATLEKEEGAWKIYSIHLRRTMAEKAEIEP